MRGVRVLATVLALASVVLVATPAKQAGAAALDGVCDPGEWCVYKDSGFRGCVLDWYRDGAATGGDMNDTDYRNCRGQKVKDSVSSYRNGPDSWLMMWEHPGGKGFTYCVAPGGTGDVLRNFNDKASTIAAVDPDEFHSRFGGEGKCNHVDRD